METHKLGVTLFPPGKMLWVTDELMALKRRATTPAGLTLSLTH
jgi:hypothetical protein